MPWHPFFAAFAAGLLLTNSIPHLTHGLAGDRFPTPFAKPPGRGLSSPLANTVWALLNLVVGTLLLRAAHLSLADLPRLATFFLGVTLVAVPLSLHFRSKHPA